MDELETRIVAWRLGLLALLCLVASAYLWSALSTIAPNSRITDVFQLATWPWARSGADSVRQEASINLLVLGYGGSDARNVTDSIMLLSIRPQSHRLAIVSLPRDLWLPMPAWEHGELMSRLDTAYAIGSDRALWPSLRRQWRTATGGGDLAAATVRSLTGLPVDAWIAVDEDSFGALVDAVGGITLTVPQALDDSRYPIDNSHRVMRIHFDTGRQHLDGERALEYVRSRMSTSDTDRGRRQQLVLVAVLQRVQTMNPAVAFLKLLGPLEQGVRTSLTLSQMADLEHALRTVDPHRAVPISIDDKLFVHPSTGGPAAENIWLPKDGTYAGLRRYLQAALESAN